MTVHRSEKRGFCIVGKHIYRCHHRNGCVDTKQIFGGHSRFCIGFRGAMIEDSWTLDDGTEEVESFPEMISSVRQNKKE